MNKRNIEKIICNYGPGLARITSTIMATTVTVVMAATATSPPITPPTMAPTLTAPPSSPAEREG